MRYRIFVTATTLLALPLGLGCDQQESATATTSASAAPTIARSDLADLCKKMCDKDVQCAGETAKQAAKAAGLDDVAEQAAKKAVEKAQTNLNDCKRECVAAAEKGATGDQGQAKVIAKCLATPDCTQYAQCIERAGLSAGEPTP